MFNRQSTPGQDTAGSPLIAAPEVPSLPALRTFTVVREGKPDEVVYGHEAEMNAAGNILRFRQYFIHPVDGPSQRIVKCFNGWVEYTEAADVTVPSGLITIPTLTSFR